jgi:hypothetical protein
MLVAQRARSTSVSIPAPVGGWNARDSAADMDEKDAIVLQNFFPAMTECRLRQGYTNFASGLPAQVETLIAYGSGASDKLYAVSNGSIYDVTNGGAVGAALKSGLSNSRFQYINIANASAQNYVLAVNGADKMQYYDGTNWTDDGTTYAITGVDTSTWTNICLHKQRVWAIQSGTLTAWYLGTSAIQGAATKFDMSQFFRMGGSLVALETWTIDAGFGVDDLLVFVSSKGEVLVYQGTDPSNASTWAMKGLWRIGSPIGARCLFKYQGDLLIICQDGLLPLSGALQSSRVQPQVALSNKIQYAVSTAISTYSGNFGWQVINFPKENQLFLNVPIATGQQQQYAMNTISGSWCNYTGWNANCWVLYKDMPYFGGSGVVGRAWDGFSDAGGNIQGSALQAYSYFETPGQLKRFTMLKPQFRCNGTPAVQASVSVDFDTTDNTAQLNYSPATASGTWGNASWGVSMWGTSNLPVYQTWQGCAGIGVAAAPRVKTASQGLDLRWVATTIVLETGAVL